MSCGVENGSFSVTNPASLDVPVSQYCERVRKLDRPFCEFHRLFVFLALDVGINTVEIGIPGHGFLYGGIAHTKRWQRQNFFDLS